MFAGRLVHPVAAGQGYVAAGCAGPAVYPAVSAPPPV
eukprot:gene30310-7104_t